MSKWGRNWKELQSSRSTTSLYHCSSYVRYTSTAILIAIYINSQIIWRIVLSFCIMTVPYLGYSLVEEEYMKYKRWWKLVWESHFDSALTSKWGRDWNELQSSRYTSSLCHSSCYARLTSSVLLFARSQLIFRPDGFILYNVRRVHKVCRKCKYIDWALLLLCRIHIFLYNNNDNLRLIRFSY
jgi:hypothetical protein